MGSAADSEPLGLDKKQLLRRFEEQETEVRISNCRRGAFLAALFIFGGAAMDVVAYPEQFVHFLLLRAACALALLGVLGLSFWNAPALGDRLLGHLCGVFPTLTILWMIVETGGGASPYYAGLNLVMVGTCLLLRWRYTDGIINALLCVGGYLVVSAATDTPVSQVAVSLFFLFVTGVFACVGLFYYNRLRFREFQLRAEVEAQQVRLASSHEKLQALDEAKTRFFANVSHELRTPLTLILAPVEKMKQSQSIRSDPQLLDYVSSLEDNGLRLLRLINDLLDLVKLDTGQLQMNPEIFRPEIFLDGLGRNLRPMAEQQKVVLTWNSNRFAEENNVFLDRDRLEKVVLNLAVNALKFTPPDGRVEMSANIEGDNLVLAVKDTGPGMTDEQVALAFERFWQADASMRRRHQGVGIGLALVKSLVESMDGSIDINSTLGEGTTFVITIPVPGTPPEMARKESREDGAPNLSDAIEALNERARLAGATGPVMSGEGTAGGLPLEAPGRVERILIAEDEEGLRSFLRIELEEMGCEVIEARDGLEAWELARQFMPNLVVADYMMPEMDGISLTRQLRESETTAQCPIVLVTARADDPTRIEALEAGVTDFLTKPFTIAELRVRIRNLLDGQRYQNELDVKNRELGKALDELHENEARLVHAEKLSSLGRMSAGIVHEVNNPLNYAKTALHALRMYTDDLPEDEREEFAETVGDAEEGVGRVIQIISDLRSFTKGETRIFTHVNLADVVESARRLLSHDLQTAGFRCEVPGDLLVTGNDTQLCQVLVNLIQNATLAVAASADRGEEPEIAVMGEGIPGGGCILRVRDNGCGISDEDREKIFDPFFTKRQVGEGMGLGLSICHRIIESHHARIEVNSEPGRFTEFTIQFPAIDAGFEDDEHDGEDGVVDDRPGPVERLLEEATTKS
jgi:signal transduction histidine kinase